MLEGTLKVDDDGGFHFIQGKHYDPLKSRLIMEMMTLAFDRDENELLRSGSDAIKLIDAV